MVRVLCQNSVGGGCCRGQMEELTPVEFMEGKSCSVIDAAMASRAAEALNAHSEDSNSNFSSDFNNSGNSDSFSDSDMETKISLSIDVADPTSDKRQNGDMKRQRRRERNKVSAQAYRQRRRAQTSTQNQMLVDLEKRHEELLATVRNLEEQKSIFEGLIKKKAKMPWPWGHPTTHPYAPVTEGTCGAASSMDAPMSMNTSAIVAS